MSPEINIFAGSSGRPFAEKMCAYLGLPLGKTEATIFSEGNTYVKIGEPVRGKEVYLVQPIGPRANDDFVELLFWMDAFKRSGAQSVTAVVPYFSYAKADKKDEPRVSIRARVCADCIELSGADRLIMMDLHAAQIQGFFKKPVDHLLARPILVEYLKTIISNNSVIVSPDAGCAKTARKFAKDLGLPVAIGDKGRDSGYESVEVLEVIGDVSGKDAIIVDDFSISGCTVTRLADELKRRGAKKVIACFSHIPLGPEGIERIEKSEIEMVIATDSVNNPGTRGMKKLKIVSVAPLFAEVVRRMQLRESIGGLFDQIPKELFAAALKND